MLLLERTALVNSAYQGEGGWGRVICMRHLTVFVLFFEGKETTSNITTVKFLFKLLFHIQ